MAPPAKIPKPGLASGEDKRVLGVPPFDVRLHPKDGAEGIEAFEPLLAEKGVPVARPSFVDVVFTALVGYRRRKKDHLSKTAQRRNETPPRSSRQVLSYLEREHEFVTFRRAQGARNHGCKIARCEAVRRDFEIGFLDPSTIKSLHAGGSQI